MLVIAVNSDASVRQLKGAGRPINTEVDRAYALASLRCVDAVFIFPGPRLDREILALRPDVYTKAGDYSLETLDPGERAALEAVHAECHFLPFVQGHSTTSLIERASHL
jgi:rfaE bifunctional protein nucleotidyltransferase chain/domain